MPEVLQPTAVIEGRAPLPGQLITRQTYLPTILAAAGVRTFYIDPHHPETYDPAGHIRRYTPYGSTTPLEARLEQPYAWRLRDVRWPHGDPQAHAEGHGYNSEKARTELATRQGLSTTLRQLGLQALEVPLLDSSQVSEYKVIRQALHHK